MAGGKGIREGCGVIIGGPRAWCVGVGVSGGRGSRPLRGLGRSGSPEVWKVWWAGELGGAGRVGISCESGSRGLGRGVVRN